MSGSTSQETNGLSLSQLELIDRIGWLVRLRWIAYIGVTATILITRGVFHSSLPWTRLLVAAHFIPVYNLIVYLDWRRVNRIGAEHLDRISARLANIQIFCDLVVLGTLIHLSGGIENLFGFYFAFHMVIASILLSRRAAFVQATAAVLIFAAMAVGEYVGYLPHYDSPIGVMFPGMHKHGTSVLAAVWVMTTALYGTVYLATSTSNRLRMREDQVMALLNEVSRNAEKLQAAYDDLARLDQAKCAYGRKVAHELRAPLAAVDSLLGVVADGLRGEICEDARDMVRRARHRVRELLAVAGDLLVLSAFDEKTIPSRLERVDIAALIETTVGLHEEYARAKRIEIAVEKHGDTPAVSGDREALEELLTNLISNAIKYSHEGGKVTIRVSTGGVGALRVEVADEGIGIAEEDRERVFDEFFRSEDARGMTSEGTGLGLSIVRAIAEAHGGSVSVQSARGVGTTFTVILPCCRDFS